MCKTLKPGYIKMMMRYFFGMFLFMPLLCFSQQKDTLVKKTDTIRVKADSIKKDSTQQSTGVHGIITDAVSGKPLAYIGVGFTGSNFGTRSDEHGYYTLTAQGSFRQVKFIFMGYKSLLKPITPGRDQVLNVKLESSQTAAEGGSN